MEKAIQLIEQRMIELERQRDSEELATEYQKTVSDNYYRGALNELARLKLKLQESR